MGALLVFLQKWLSNTADSHFCSFIYIEINNNRCLTRIANDHQSFRNLLPLQNAFLLRPF